MGRRLRVVLLLLVLSLTFSRVYAADDQSSKWSHVHFGGLTVGAGYSHFSGPFWTPYYSYPYAAGGLGWYDPWFGSYPFFAPGFFSGFSYQGGYGKVRLKSVSKASTVFIDGGFAGDAGHVKDLWLQPGVYRIELANNGRTVSRKIYVLSGKTLNLSEQDFNSSTN